MQKFLAFSLLKQNGNFSLSAIVQVYVIEFFPAMLALKAIDN